MVRSKRSAAVLLSMILVLVLSGCYRNKPVESHQMGLKLSDGVSIDEVVGPGRHFDGGWYAELIVINVSNITTQWTDPSLVTRDKQPIGLVMNITFARKTDTESLKALYNRYNREAIDDGALSSLVLTRVPGVAKTITTRYTLDQMLGIADGQDTEGRQQLANEVTDLLRTELQQIHVDLTTVEIADIVVSQEYLAALNAKAQASISMEVANQQTKLLTEQLAQEKAQTEIELEKARRENLVNAEMAKAYEESPELLQMRLMELTVGMLDKGDTVIYVPEGSNITNVLTQAQVTPIE